MAININQPIFRFDTRKGSLRDHVSGTVPTNTDVVIKKSDKGRAARFKGDIMKQIKMSLEVARRIYSASGRVTRSWILENFTKSELMGDDELPTSVDDLGSVFYNTVEHKITETECNIEPHFIVTSYTGHPSDGYDTIAQANAESPLRTLTHLIKAYNGDWEPEWKDDEDNGYIIMVFVCTLNITKADREPQLLTFETEEKATHFLKHHLDLIKQAAPILWGVVL